ncbi:MAG: 5-methyltetrahydropteroyltriglutamate--homocyste i ne methyltransferase [Solirubrobacterales bacterium]|nr:5-methyltetrahydropteroyltriglutamate--homocyste i ne methyltransferase [Solirubrobacterales bacterium]
MQPETVRSPARVLTSLVGSYAQPDWLIDRDRLRERFPPRVRATELWRVDRAYLEEAQDDATRSAIVDQERAGLDIITDGEIRRESYSNRFATALEGVDLENPGSALDRSGHPNAVPRVVGPIVRGDSVQVRDMRFLRSNTSRLAKITIPGPFTMSQQAQDDYYGSREDLGAAYADAVRQEIVELFDAGADVVQLDEPYMQARPDAARAYGLEVLRRATDGLGGTLAIHICFGYAAIIHERPSGYSFLPELVATECQQISIETAQSGLELDVLDALRSKTIILGVLDLSTNDVETPAVVAQRIGRAFPYAEAGRLIAAPDCGMKYLPRDVAYAKLESLVEGAAIASAAMNPNTNRVDPR